MWNVAVLVVLASESSFLSSSLLLCFVFYDNFFLVICQRKVAKVHPLFLPRVCNHVTFGEILKDSHEVCHMRAPFYHCQHVLIFVKTLQH